MRRNSGLLLTLVVALTALGCGGDGGSTTTQALGATGASGPTGATTATAETARFQRALDHARRRTNVPGATAAVVRNGEVVWSGASGFAVASGEKRRMRPETLFAIASTTKSVVAAMALRLAEDGELDLDAPIAGLGIDVPGAGRITPRMLMHHTSGLSDYFGGGFFARKLRDDPTYRWTREEIIERIRGLDFEPGKRFSYSNSGYVVLGGVLEAASGESIEELFRRYIADPLGLTRSSFAYDPDRSDEFAAPHFSIDRGRWRNRWRHGVVRSDYWGEVWTDGGLGADAAELALFGNAMIAGDLLEPESLEAAVPRPGRGTYGLGLERFDIAGSTWIGHTGFYGGIGTENFTEPDKGVTVVVMVNSNGSRGSASNRVWKAIVAAL